MHFDYNLIVWFKIHYDMCKKHFLIGKCENMDKPQNLPLLYVICLVCTIHTFMCQISLLGDRWQRMWFNEGGFVIQTESMVSSLWQWIIYFGKQTSDCVMLTNSEDMNVLFCNCLCVIDSKYCLVEVAVEHWDLAEELIMRMS